MHVKLVKMSRGTFNVYVLTIMVDLVYLHNSFTTSRVAFIHQLLKQKSYVYILFR